MNNPEKASETHALSIYSELLCCFCTKKPNLDMIYFFTMLALRKMLTLAFIIFGLHYANKAFNLISSESIVKMLPLIDHLPKLINVIRSFEDTMMTVVKDLCPNELE